MVRTEPENFSSFVRSTSVRRTCDINANQGLTSISGGSCTAQRVNYSRAHSGPYPIGKNEGPATMAELISSDDFAKLDLQGGKKGRH